MADTKEEVSEDAGVKDKVKALAKKFCTNGKISRNDLIKLMMDLHADDDAESCKSLCEDMTPDGYTTEADLIETLVEVYNSGVDQKYLDEKLKN